MTVHIMGICGTFMGGVAQLAAELGIAVRGSDANVYPPMSTLLEELGIEIQQGYRAENLLPRPESVVVGNALSRGNPEVEALLEADIPFLSGPGWLYHNVLRGRRTLAVAGTHGKTTTSSMLAWILRYAGRDPGFLIGGVAHDLQRSATLGGGPFVVEADEYDSAFFDKRSKFVHYFPTTLILNNLEFDHADIFADLGAIQTQFHHLIRTVRASGTLIVNQDDANLAQVLKMGCWSRCQFFSLQSGSDAHWSAKVSGDGSGFELIQQGQSVAEVNWRMSGEHNVSNALAAIAAAHEEGVSVEESCKALSAFAGVRRRMDLVGEKGGVQVYDDFAHHPTAIRATLQGARRRFPKSRIIAVLEPRSNSMRAGAHTAQLPPALAHADLSWVYSPPELVWDAESVLAPLGDRLHVHSDMSEMLSALGHISQPGDCLVFMSNGSFLGAPGKMLKVLNGDSP